MTEAQKNSIQKIYSNYLENMDQFSSYVPQDYCKFRVYFNEKNPDDQNIVVEWIRIMKLNDSLLPETELLNFLIEPIGFYYDMNSLKDVFKSNFEVNLYISKLKKLNWDGK